MIVVVTVTLEIRAEIKKRLRKQLFGAQKQGYQKPAHASVAIQKGMNGFKLVVNECKTNESGHFGGRMKILLESVQRAMHFFDRRRHIGRIR